MIRGGLLGNLRFLVPPYGLKSPRRHKYDPSWRHAARRGGFQWCVIVLMLLVIGDALLARTLNLEVMPVGYRMSEDEVLDTLGRNVVRPGVANQAAGALRLLDMEATTRRRENPAWLVLSNAPEVLDEVSMPKARGVLVSADVPAGPGSLLASHSNLHPLAQDLVLRIINRADEPADIYINPRATAQQNLIPGAYSVDAAVGGLLARSYLDALHAPPAVGWSPPDGDRHRIIMQGRSSDVRLFSSLRGLGMSWLTLTSSTPLHLTLYSVPNGAPLDDAVPVLPRLGSQRRGFFEHPDTGVEARIDLTDGETRRYVFGGAERNNRLGILDGGSWMTGIDSTEQGKREPQTNCGDFGGVTFFRATVNAPVGSPYIGVLFLLVAGGRKAAILPRPPGRPCILNQWEGLLLGRTRVGETFQYEFTLPPNSWAPVYLVAVPLRHM